MALSFGPDLDDVTADEDALDSLLSGADRTEPEYVPDPDPGWDEPEKLTDRVTSKIRGAAARPVRVTAAVRKDVRAKTAMLLSVGARTWEGRDSYCGGAAVAAVPDVSAALADIFCDSPDLVRWFSAGTGYMKWLNLAMAVQPVVEAAWAHHVVHSVVDEGADEGDWSRYVA